MDKNYQYWPTTKIIAGGYDGEEIGASPEVSDWITTNETSGTTNYQYFFRDSDSSQNCASSKVVISAQDEWTASIDNANNLTINIQTTISSIVRTDLIQTCGTIPSTAVRNIYIRADAGGANLFQVLNDHINTAHTISGEVTLPAQTFVLAPGEDTIRGSMWVMGCVPGHEGDSDGSIYVDRMWAGPIFRNILPKDYRPGMTWNGSAFMSHNRNNGGVCNYWNGSAWVEMRTQGYPTDKGNSPLLYRDGDWWNQAKIGQE